MKIGIIAAMEEELDLLIKQIQDDSVVYFGQFGYYTGTINDIEVAVMLCGIGKVNAAVGTTLLIDKFNPNYVINIGVAGGFSDKLKVGDIVISTDVRHHDADATAFQYEYGQIPQMPVAFTASPTLVNNSKHIKLKDESVQLYIGSILSGDTFVHDKKQIKLISQRFPNVMAVEMEGAAIAQTCYLFDIPFVLIRSISDKVHEEGSHISYEDFVVKAADNSVNLVLELINNLKGIQ